MAKQSPPRWVSSRYLRVLPMGNGGALLYSGLTGAALTVPVGAVGSMQRILRRTGSREGAASADAPVLLPHLVAGGFVVPDGFDELSLLVRRYRAARAKARYLLTILPTFACNLRCDYCFVAHERGTMGRAVEEAIIRRVRSRFARKPPPSMNVDWLGGEPLLAMNSIRRLSRVFLDVCRAHGAAFSAQVITNGTLLNEGTTATLLACGVDRLQITLDGPKAQHDRRRPSRRRGESSYNRILGGLEAAVGRFIVRLRVNVDARNLTDVLDLLDVFDARGWLRPGSSFYPYLARVSAFTESCRLPPASSCGRDEFFELQTVWLKRLAARGVPVALQELYHFPGPRLYNCAAIGSEGTVVLPDGSVHLCGLTIDDRREAIGTVFTRLSRSRNAVKWRRFYPFSEPKCKACLYLPSCLGGCPRNTIARRTADFEDHCLYHRTWEDRMLVLHAELAGSEERGVERR